MRAYVARQLLKYKVYLLVLVSKRVIIIISLILSPTLPFYPLYIDFWLLETLFQFYTSFLGILGPFAFSVFLFCHPFGGILKIERILEAALVEDNLLHTLCFLVQTMIETQLENSLLS